MLTIAQKRWEECRRWFSEDECDELDGATTDTSYAPAGFVIDESVLRESTRAKVRFHFLEKTGRIARGAAL
jgi:hypothetical protein